MIRIGEYQTLEIDRELPQGFYLIDDDDDDVLMPRAYITDEMEIGDEIVVFVYCDSYGREIATTDRPLLTVGEFAYLEVKSVNDVGAFCEWGTSKELLIPHANQASRLQEGESYVIHMYLDEFSERLVGSTKLNKYLKNIVDDNIKMGQEVNLLVSKETDIGYKVIINQTYGGLLYKNEVEEGLSIGQSISGFIKPLRPDGKIDVSLHHIGYEGVVDNEEIILDKLKENEGHLPFTDKSDPMLIRKEFGMSKKLFKKILGSLYKKRLITLKKDGIYAK